MNLFASLRVVVDFSVAITVQEFHAVSNKKLYGYHKLKNAKNNAARFHNT